MTKTRAQYSTKTRKKEVLNEHVLSIRTRQETEHNTARALVGLSALVPKERPCMQCSTVFLSFKDKRQCPQCVRWLNAQYDLTY